MKATKPPKSATVLTLVSVRFSTAEGAGGAGSDTQRLRPQEMESAHPNPSHAPTERERPALVGRRPHASHRAGSGSFETDASLRRMAPRGDVLPCDVFEKVPIYYRMKCPRCFLDLPGTPQACLGLRCAACPVRVRVRTGSVVAAEPDSRRDTPRARATGARAAGVPGPRSEEERRAPRRSPRGLCVCSSSSSR